MPEIKYIYNTKKTYFQQIREKLTNQNKFLHYVCRYIIYLLVRMDLKRYSEDISGTVKIKLAQSPLTTTITLVGFQSNP